VREEGLARICCRIAGLSSVEQTSQFLSLRIHLSSSATSECIYQEALAQHMSCNTKFFA